MDQELLRQIPGVDELLRRPELNGGDAPRTAVTAAVRQTLEELRREILAGEIREIPTGEILCARVLAELRRQQLPSLRRVINATGVVLHTNLGRSCLSDAAATAAADAARNYSTLEYDCAAGSRGRRDSHTEELLCRLTGAESAMVVNNNAAAVLLMLTALAAGGEVIVSRGELVEIGGSFRIPEIMEACGAVLREVGATNKTRIEDYAGAISERSRALLKVHTSNYRIVGFTESADPAALVSLGHARGLPVLQDLGSGSLADLAAIGIRGEPTVQAAIAAGTDVVTFSGDKLLGGPQAGIITGRKVYLDRMKRHPLARAVRPDKMTLAALEATLRAYEEETAWRDIPTLAMLAKSPETLRAEAEDLCARLQEAGVDAAVIPEYSQVGGGAVPTERLATFAVGVLPRRGSVDALETALRQRPVPVITRIAHGRCLLDLRTLRPADRAELTAAMEETAI